MLTRTAAFLAVAVVGITVAGCAMSGARRAGTMATTPPVQCESVDVDIAADAKGHVTRDGAFDAFARESTTLRGAELDGNIIRLRGKRVGTVAIGRTEVGGFYVESAEWCPAAQS